MDTRCLSHTELLNICVPNISSVHKWKLFLSNWQDAFTNDASSSNCNKQPAILRWKNKMSINEKLFNILTFTFGCWLYNLTTIWLYTDGHQYQDKWKAQCERYNLPLPNCWMIIEMADTCNWVLYVLKNTVGDQKYFKADISLRSLEASLLIAC